MHLLHRSMKPRSDGAGRPAEDIGGLLRSEARVVVQDDDRPMVHVQPAEPAIQLVTIEEAPRLVGFGRVKGRNMHLAAAPGASTSGPRDGTR